MRRESETSTTNTRAFSICASTGSVLEKSAHTATSSTQQHACQGDYSHAHTRTHMTLSLSIYSSHPTSSGSLLAAALSYFCVHITSSPTDTRRRPISEKCRSNDEKVLNTQTTSAGGHGRVRAIVAALSTIATLVAWRAN